ncbi:MAG: hypothetical protein U1B30_10460 [Pseudomonadota bacterium]|nr:hypothetical protein [Pseudomonadota bacterium]
MPAITEGKEMNKSRLMFAASYFISIFLLIGVIVFYNWLNTRLEAELTLSSKHVENTELQSKLIERIQSGKMRSEEYVEIFKAKFEHEKANYESEMALIELNSSFKEIIASILALQLFFLTLYIMQRPKT